MSFVSHFEYNGKPVIAAEAAAIISERRSEWRRNRLGRARDRDMRDGAIWRQLWAMIRGRA
jgi:hypothetical protein